MVSWVLMVLLIVVQTCAGLRLKREVIMKGLDTETRNLKDKLSKTYISEGDDIMNFTLSGIDKASELARKNATEAELQEFVKEVQQAIKTVGEISRPQPEEGVLLGKKELQDVAAGIGSLAQFALMASLAPPLGPAFGCLAGTIGGLLGRGGTVRISTVVDNLIMKRLREARFSELIAKSEGAVDDLETKYTMLKGMMKVNKNDWTSVDKTVANVEAQSASQVAFMGELMGEIRNAKADEEQSFELEKLIDVYAELFYLRVILMSMKLQIARMHGLDAIAQGVADVIQKEKLDAKGFFRFLETPDETVGTRVLNIHPQSSIFTFAKLLGRDMYKWQKSLIGNTSCYHIHNVHWPDYYWTVAEDKQGYSYRGLIEVSNEDYSVTGDRGKFDVLPGSSNEFISFKPRIGDFKVGVGYIPTVEKIDDETYEYVQYNGWNVVVSRETTDRSDDWKAIRLSTGKQQRLSDHWYIKPRHIGSPVYIPKSQWTLQWGYLVPSGQGMFKLIPC